MVSQTFGSRLLLVGEYVLETPLRIGDGVGGIALDSTGAPLIPASTFRGALRAYVESILRALQTTKHDVKRTVTLRGPDGRPTPTQRTVRLCCDSVDKRDDDAGYQGCLTRAIVTRWEADPILRPNLDSTLVECTCGVCRLFGAPWIAGRVQIADLRLNGTWTGTYEQRGGAAIDSETDTAIAGSSYQYRAVPPGSRFTFRLTVEDASAIEQGMILAGMFAFQNGLIALGGRRSAGLGRGSVELDWPNCRQVDAEHLIDALLGGELLPFTESDAEARIAALGTLLKP